MEGEKECSGDPVQRDVSYARYEPQLGASGFPLNADFDSRASGGRLGIR